jgi:ABC-type multidrug transport system permease subunit
MAQAMVPSSIFMMILVIYTGFTIPVRDMHPWFRWLNYLNPIAVRRTQWISCPKI